MTSPIESYIRRDYSKKKDEWLWVKIAAIVLIGAMAYALYIFTPTVHAESEMRYQDVHTESQLREFMKENPYTVITRI